VIWRAWPSVLGARWLFALAFSVAALASDGAAGGTAEALAALRTALAALDRGDTAGAQRTLMDARTVVADVAVDLDGFRTSSDAAARACDAGLRRLEGMRGELVAAHEAAEDRLMKARGSAELALARRDSANAELSRLHAWIEETNAALRRHQERLEELNQWGWVPGYGTFLGIRELIDNDREKFQSLWRDVQSLNSRVEHEERELRLAGELAQEAARAEGRTRMQLLALDGLRADLLERLRSWRELADHAHDADLFWDDVETTLRISVRGSLARLELDLRRLLGRVGEPVTTPRLLHAPAISYFGESLAALSQQIASGELRARLTSEDCRIMDRPEEWLHAIETCPDLPRYPYFRFTNAAACRFVYVDPSNCPPQALNAELSPSAQIATQQNLRASRMMMPILNRNWIGADRCVAQDLTYFGKLNGWGLCARSCGLTTGCTVWTYQLTDEILPGRAGECWGRDATVPPDTTASSDWSGFISGSCLPGSC
jgi:hypothetical protein